MVDLRIDHIVDDVRLIREDVSDLLREVSKNSVTLEQNKEDIAEHIKRTAILETQMNTALIPIQFAKWSVAIAGGLATIGGILVGIYRLLVAAGIK